MPLKYILYALGHLLGSPFFNESFRFTYQKNIGGELWRLSLAACYVVLDEFLKKDQTVPRIS